MPFRYTFRHVALVGTVLLLILVLYYEMSDFGAPLPHAPFMQPSHSRTSPEEWAERAHSVKQAFLHAYQGYQRHAAPHDELKPLSNGSVDNFNGWGVSIYDSLDTMILMELHDEFARALPAIREATFELKSQEAGDRDNPPREVYAPFFETVIRYVGGLLSAYALTHEPILIQKADELAKLLSPVFSTSSGFPLYGVNTVNGKTIGPKIGILAEIASCQLEYTYLAQLTGNKEHFDKSAGIRTALEQADLRDIGMLPMRFNLTTGQPSVESVSVGGAADSAHEYLLKHYLLTAQTEEGSLDLYVQTTNRILTDLLYISPARSLLYVTDVNGQSGSPSHNFEHLSCFLPGLLALGAHTLPSSAFSPPPHVRLSKKQKLLSAYNLQDLHMWAATGLAESCWLLYADQPTGLGPEEVLMKTSDASGHAKAGGGSSGLWIDALENWRKKGANGVPPGVEEKQPVSYTEDERHFSMRSRIRDYGVRKYEYLLRPETIESMYILWKVTGDPRWRERGWQIFQAIERHTKTESGYACLKDVERMPPVLTDDMPSFFLAETLKYLYLLFLEEDPLPLDKWVFNTEAHPFPIFSWTSWEKQKFGISKVAG